MKIAGLIKNSFIDYRGRVAAVIFTPYCNMDCFYCHNSQILVPSVEKDLISEKKVFDFLNKRKKLIGGVVISGGEPTLQKGLTEFIRKVKVLGFDIKIDTNGTNPDLADMLIEEKLIDYIAMDIKAPFNRYNEICGRIIDIKTIKKSIDIIMQDKIDYEFRTTVPPQINLSDIKEISKMIFGAKRYALQQFKMPQPLPLEKNMDKRNLEEPHKPSFFKKAKELIKNDIKTVEIRGI